MLQMTMLRSLGGGHNTPIILKRPLSGGDVNGIY